MGFMNGQTTTPLVTVVIPVFNAEKYLEECLQSVINQTYTNLEILVIDDGSTDSSFNIASRVAAEDRRVHVIREENAGPGAARNRGLRSAHGEYLQFLDADDLLADDAIHTAMEYAIHSGADIVCFNFEIFDNKGRYGRGLPGDFPAMETSSSRQCLMQMYAGHLGYFSWAFLFRIASVRDSQMHYPIGITMLEDMLMLNALFRHDLTVVYCHRILYKYRVVGNSLSHATSYERANDAFIVLQQIIDMARLDNTLEYFAPNAVRLLVYADSILPLSYSKKSKRLHTDIKRMIKQLLRITGMRPYDNKTKLKIVLICINVFRLIVFVRKRV